MMKSLLVALVISAFLVIGAATYTLFPQQETSEIKTTDSYLSNVTTLRAFFSGEMKDTVDYTLSLVGCKPTEYYYWSSDGEPSICYVCKDTDACFGYIAVDRIGNEVVAPNGPIYLKAKEFGVKNVNFYYDGLGTHLHCTKSDDGSDKLKCEYDVNFVYDEGEIKMTANDAKIKDLSSVICDVLRSTEEVTCTKNEYDGSYVCECGNVFVKIFRGYVTYGYMVR